MDVLRVVVCRAACLSWLYSVLLLRCHFAVLNDLVQSKQTPAFCLMLH
jgi:hypothetical protein